VPAAPLPLALLLVLCGVPGGSDGGAPVGGRLTGTGGGPALLELALGLFMGMDGGPCWEDADTLPLLL